MRNLFVYMTMSFDGFIAGPNNELDWMNQRPDPELNDDIVQIIASADTGIMGYPTASGMIPYWASVAQNPSASKEERAIAEVVNKVHSIVVSNKPEKLEGGNAELLLAKDDQELVEAVTRLKQQPGGDMGIPGGVRTAQTFARLGLVDEYVLMVQPVAIGNGKRLFTTKVDLELKSAKTYKSGVMCVRYCPSAK